jgi:hypothetical protein
VRDPSSGSFVRHCAESAGLAPAGALARTGHLESPFSPCGEMPGSEMGGNGVTDE